MIASRLTIGLLFLTLLQPSCQTKSATGTPQSQSPTRTPTFAYQESGGCNDVFLYTKNDAGTEVLVVSADKKKLGISTRPRTFDIGSAPQGLTVSVDLYTRPPRYFPYCTDMVDDKAESPTTWQATKGSVTITLAEPDPHPRGSFQTYKATVKLEEMVFEDAAGHQATAKEPITAEAVVGWVPG